MPDSSRWLDCFLQVLPLKPGDFPLYSNRSRAAARTLQTERQTGYERREVIISNRTNSPHATEWRFDIKEHTAGRVISIPEGMTLEHALRKLGGYSEREIAQVAEHCPEPLNAGTMLMMRR